MSLSQASAGLNSLLTCWVIGYSDIEVICKYLGYTFGYRHQFGLFTFNFAKPLAIGTWVVATLRSITLIYHKLTVFSGNSKSVEGNFVGVQLPLPAPSLFLSKSFSSNDLHSLQFCCREGRSSRFRYKNGYSAYPHYFEWFRKVIICLEEWVTEYAADNRSA
jgi:hypothetical protein